VPAYITVAKRCGQVERSVLKKIGVYGGTFDPVHHAHLILARDALEQLGFDQIIFVPAAISPLKKSGPIASGEVRLAMLRAAIQNELQFAVNDCELRRGAPSYTIETVEEIRRDNPDASIYCMIGEDNVGSLTQWHRFAELEKLVEFVVLDRSGSSPRHSYPVINRKIDISATEIRRRVASDRSIRYFVPPAVEEIIAREKLYQEQSK
jgi:nicotinate-nucleotide adenylyltransferase